MKKTITDKAIINKNKPISLVIGYLYGDLMNIYGDLGNIITLKKRAQDRGIKVTIKNLSLKDKLKPKDIDLFFFGGGQDQAQSLVAKDLKSSGKAKVIKSEVERGVPVLAICGGYQLLGEYYQPPKGPKLEGINLFPSYTLASHDRMIGNIVIQAIGELKNLLSQENKTQSNNYQSQMLVGFENHSGKTYLKEGAIPLGKVKKGFGNNGEDKYEGCIYKNAIGCYMHGSLLPKNPRLADHLIQKALETKYNQQIKLKPLDDSLEEKAHQVALEKFG